mmetsp:Transcript_39274/g.47565  ORF Transcript_39274/g.47565 Transcript_39274/m.47565 type:complete len:224 (-) Transcript_39274:103-774(-)|eukprot:CAMPEP_0197845930 /NCGR_PEP_ID=MMETSP1438-20131217/2782_1 /TAXON_ID=1461541 /ORGANISM="Pterosperma sp., Strain CCMP1384" /LENGTH=223 /DNA_ID=CAMNT_0043457403 /DNA_START=46 /DNA_END=717 /DNA_ORIENTATION=+
MSAIVSKSALSSLITAKRASAGRRSNAPKASGSKTLSWTQNALGTKSTKQQVSLPVRSGLKCVAAAAEEVSKAGSDATGQAMPPFHLAIPVHDVELAREFYGGMLGCPEGRSAARWVDFNFYGHQLVCHKVDGYTASSSANAVDGDPVPVPHFGLAMSHDDFHELAERVRAAGIEFIIEPHIRFEGAPGEQWTMFFKDVSGNSLEFKSMTNPENLFAKYTVTV